MSVYARLFEARQALAPIVAELESPSCRLTPNPKVLELAKRALEDRKGPYQSLEDYGISCPQLVLAIKADEDGEKRFAFKSDRVFHPVQHQTAGVGCHQVYMWATVLRPNHEAQEAMKAIHSHWYDSGVGAFSVWLDSIIEYRKQLAELLGVDCAGCYGDFEEAIYPIDCTKESLTRVCTDTLPDDLDDLVEWKDGLEKFCGCIGRWSLFMLTENSD